MSKQKRSYASLSIVAVLALVLPLLSAPVLQARAPDSDTIAPSPVASLTAGAGASAGTVELAWIAPGDDGTTGTASSYVVCYDDEPITEANWASAADVSGEPAPSPAGSFQTMTVSGLTPGRLYYFALKTQDEVPNTSGISNSPLAWPGRWPNAVYLPDLKLNASAAEPVIPDTTEVLPQSTTQYLESISQDGAEFTFSQSTPELDELAPGDIMVGDVADNAPYGFLRKVVPVSDAGG